MDLNDVFRHQEIRSRIQRKASLRLFYREVYLKYANSLAKCPSEGVALELGSGCGFAKEVIPDMVTSDVIAYPGVDRVIDATKMDFPSGSLRFICMLNVLHHISDAERFFCEVRRCLRPGGRVFIVDQYAGLFSSVIYRLLHHEPFDPNAETWAFESSGPLSGANGALAKVIFERDKQLFETLFPELLITKYQPHSPLRYWLSGGLKNWSILPAWAFPAATTLDKALTYFAPRFGSFVDIELVREETNEKSSL